MMLGTTTAGKSGGENQSGAPRFLVDLTPGFGAGPLTTWL